MKNNKELTDLLERCHPFLIHALCTIPANNKDYIEASKLSDELNSFLYPAVRKAFELDKKRQK